MSPRSASPRTLELAVESLMVLSRALTRIVARTLAELEKTLSVSQCRILVTLYFDSPVTVTTIAHGLGVDRSNASRQCDRLVTAGLVQRAQGVSDRRTVALSLTPRGPGLLDSVMDRRRELLGSLVARLAPRQRDALGRGVVALVDVIEGATDWPDIEMRVHERTLEPRRIG